MTDRDVGLLERHAFDAWPAEEVVKLAGWRLRASHGVTNRANSVWPNQLIGSMGLDERLARVEAFYADRELPTRFQISPAASPGDLDAQLACRGYARYAPVSIQTARATEVARREVASEISVTVSETLEDAWFDLSGRRGRFRGAARLVYRGILERVEERAGFALARRGGLAVGVGLGVAGGDWVGVFAMRTLPDARRRGVGRSVVAALARWGQARGAAHLYLQVEEANAGALALYRAAGFSPKYGYHYRRAPE